MDISRRVFIKETTTATLLVLAGSFMNTLHVFADLEPTPPNTAGPFYVPDAPLATGLRVAGDSGQPILVTGKITNTRTEALSKAKLEIWHTDPKGHYDMEGYRYRATVPVAKDGSYRYETYVPGAYSSRPQHIHYRITSPGHQPLFTQLYFENDPFFEGQPNVNYRKDSIVQYPELIRPVERNRQEWAVYFQIILKAV